MPEGIRLLAGGLVLTGSRLNRVKCVCKVACLGFGLRWVGGWREVTWEEGEILRLNSCIHFPVNTGKETGSTCAFLPGEV